MDWMQRLAPLVNERQLVTDVGSTKLRDRRAGREAVQPARQSGDFLPGHPMAGKESGGRVLAEAELFKGAMWLFYADPERRSRRALNPSGGTGCDALVRAPWIFTPARHDELCAWVSHLPQMVPTALSALLEDTFATDAPGVRKSRRLAGARYGK